MTRFNYGSYSGTDSYIYILCGAADRGEAAAVANALAERGFRTAYEVFDNKETNEAEIIADNVARSSGTLVFLSENACSVKVYRNCINFIVDNPDPDLYVRLGGYKLKDGLDIQLANKQVMEYAGADAVVDKMMADGIVTQDMKAAPGEIAASAGSRRKTLVSALIAAALFILVLALAGGAYSAFRYRQDQLAKLQAENDEYHQSDEYILTHMNTSADNARYIDFSKYNKDSLVWLDGLVIGTLDLSDCGFEDISAVSGIDVSVVNVSGNPGIATLEPLLECPHLRKVIVSEDMLGMTGIFDGTGVIVEIQ